MPVSNPDGESRPATPKEAEPPYDPRKKRGPPQRLEDTDASGDAFNGTGDDNQRHKSDPSS